MRYTCNLIFVKKTFIIPLCAIILFTIKSFGQDSRLAINVGFDASGKLQFSEGAALTLWGKTINHHSHDHIHDIDLSIFPMVESAVLWAEVGILATDYQIVEAEFWPDYVFDENYYLPPLEEVAHSIKTEGCLKSNRPVQFNKPGSYTIKNLNIDLMTKIEELNLYVIEQGKSLNALELNANRIVDETDSLMNEIELLVSRMDKNIER